MFRKQSTYKRRFSNECESSYEDGSEPPAKRMTQVARRSSPAESEQELSGMAVDTQSDAGYVPSPDGYSPLMDTFSMLREDTSDLMIQCFVGPANCDEDQEEAEDEAEEEDNAELCVLMASAQLLDAVSDRPSINLERDRPSINLASRAASAPPAYEEAELPFIGDDGIIESAVSQDYV